MSENFSTLKKNSAFLCDYTLNINTQIEQGTRDKLKNSWSLQQNLSTRIFPTESYSCINLEEIRRDVFENTRNP